MRADGRWRLVGGGLVAAVVAAVVILAWTWPARAADVGAPPAGPSVDGSRGTRDLSTLTSREAVLVDQTAAARAAVRWRLRALARLAAAPGALDGVVRARALDAGTRALARELAESRTLDRERDQLRTERDALAVASREDATVGSIGAPPAFVLPVAGAVVARFGVGPDRATGLLVSRTGVRLAAAPRAPARAPAAGTVALVAAEPEGVAVVLDHGAGWTTIVAGLAGADVVAGARVAAGERLGVAAAGTPNAPPAVSFEVWRGLRPVDPLLLLRPASAALAAPARLP